MTQFLPLEGEEGSWGSGISGILTRVSSCLRFLTLPALLSALYFEIMRMWLPSLGCKALWLRLKTNKLWMVKEKDGKHLDLGRQY